MLLDITNLGDCRLPSVHPIGCKILESGKACYIDAYDLWRVVAMEYACQLDANIRDTVYKWLAGNLKNRLSLTMSDLLMAEKEVHAELAEFLDDYADAVVVGTLDNGDEKDDILAAVDRKIEIMLRALSGKLRYELAGAYAVSLCKVNNSEMYVIKLDFVGNGFDETNGRKSAQRDMLAGNCNIDVGIDFVWMGKRVRFEKVVHVEVKE